MDLDYLLVEKGSREYGISYEEMLYLCNDNIPIWWDTTNRVCVNRGQWEELAKRRNIPKLLQYGGNERGGEETGLITVEDRENSHKIICSCGGRNARALAEDIAKFPFFDFYRTYALALENHFGCLDCLLVARKGNGFSGKTFGNKEKKTVSVGIGFGDVVHFPYSSSKRADYCFYLHRSWGKWIIEDLSGKDNVKHRTARLSQRWGIKKTQKVIIFQMPERIDFVCNGKAAHAEHPYQEARYNTLFTGSPKYEECEASEVIVQGKGGYIRLTVKQLRDYAVDGKSVGDTVTIDEK